MNWLDITIIIFLFLALINGYKSGAVMQITNLAGIVFSIIFAGKLSEVIIPYFPQLTDMPPYFLPPMAYMASFFLIIFVFLLFGKTIESLFKISQLNFFNRILGAIFAVAASYAIIGIILVLLINMDRKQIILKEHTKQSSLLYKPFVYLGETLVPFLKTHTDSFWSTEN